MTPLANIERRMMVLTAVLMSALIVCFITMVANNALELRRHEQQLRASVIADALAASIGRALAYDIPMNRLAGIDTVFAARMRDSGDIVRIVLTDPAGQVVAERNGNVGDGEAVTPVIAAIEKNAAALGQVSVYFVPATLLDVVAFPSSVGGIVLIVAMMLARGGIRYSVRRGAEAREEALLVMSRRIANADFTATVRETSPRSFDMRVSWLAVQIRDLNERRLRLQRLVDSLLHTEPELEERQRLTALVTEATQGIQFAPVKPERHRIKAVWSDLGWILYLAFAGFWTSVGMLLALPALPLWYKP